MNTFDLPEHPEELEPPKAADEPTPETPEGEGVPENPEEQGNPGEEPTDPKLEKAEKAKPSTLKALLFLLIKLGVVALIIWLLLLFVFGVYRLSGNNMYPMLKDGDLCITYRLDSCYSGDVVAYRVDGEIRIGRIVACAGDVVNGDSIGLLINFSRPTEEIFYSTQMVETALDLPVTLKKGEYLILNDYREDLWDSRSYGLVREEDLEGKVVFIFRRRGV